MRLRRYIGTHDGFVACLIVMASAGALAVFVCRTFVIRGPGQYQIDFGAARWIQLEGAARTEAGYFRKSVYLDAPVERGWIAIAATGNYQLFVNRTLVGYSRFPGVRTTGMYDITKLLLPGRNIIAVYVSPGDYPGPAQVLVHARYSLASSPTVDVDSDSSWRVSATPDGIIGSTPWTGRELDDSGWAKASETQNPELFSTVQLIDFDPNLFELRPVGRWITGASSDASDVAFGYDLDLPADWRRRTWLEVAATGPYKILINGRLAASQSFEPESAPALPAANDRTGELKPHREKPAPIRAVLSPNSGLPGVDNPASALPPGGLDEAQVPTLSPARDRVAATRLAHAGSMDLLDDLADVAARIAPSAIQAKEFPRELGLQGGAPLLLAYDITDWVKPGRNSFSIDVRSQSGPALLYADGFSDAAGARMLRFATDHRWRALSYSPASTTAAHSSPAVVVSDYLHSAWGPLPQLPAITQEHPGETLHDVLCWVGTTSALVTAVVLLWLSAAAIGASLSDLPVERFLTSDALMHLPLLGFLATVWLLACDVRLPGDWCYRPIFVALAVTLLALGKMSIVSRANDGPPVSAVRKRPDGWSHYWLVALVMIVLVGGAVRYAGLLDASFAHDEAKMAEFSNGVLAIGYPYTTVGSYTRWLCTYELVPYFLAASSLLFGKTVLAYRLPALAFGTLTIGLVGWTGYRLINWRVGLIAALIYAFLPAPVYWSRDGFYPAQESFFALLTVWLFFETIRTRPLGRAFLVATAGAFILTYFSWEGSGFILPSLFVAILVLRWGEYDWMSERRLWWAFLIVAVIVISQLCIRQVLLPPDFLGIVTNLSEVTTPTPVFLSSGLFQPFYYAKGLFLAENYVILSLLAIIALIGRSKRQGVLYVCVVLVTLELLYTCFLPAYAPRYEFQAIPLLVIAGVAGFFKIWEAIFRVDGSGLTRPAIAVRTYAFYAFVVMFVAAETPLLTKLYRLTVQPTSPPYYGRFGVQYKPDYRSAGLYLAQHFKTGDAVLARQSHMIKFFTERAPDYSWDTLLNSRINYDGGQKSPVYIDKWTGVPVLRSLNEILALRSRYSRVWIVSTKGCMPAFDFDDRLFLRTWGKVVVDGNCEQVIRLSGASIRSLQETTAASR